MQTCRRNNSAFKIPLTPFGYVFQNCLLVFAHISQRNGFCRWPVKLVLTHQSSAECCHGQKAQTKSQWWSGSAYPFTIVPPNEAPAWVCERLSVCLVTGSPTVCNKHCDTQLPLFLYHCFCLRTPAHGIPVNLIQANAGCLHAATPSRQENKSQFYSSQVDKSSHLTSYLTKSLDTEISS